MGNCFFGYPDWGVHSPETTLSGGSWETSLPLENMFDPDSSKVARSTSATAANTQFDIDLGDTDRQIKGIALIRHNLSINATVRIQIDSDVAFGTPDYDSGVVNIYQDVYPNSMPQWESSGLQNNDISADEYNQRGYRLNYIDLGMDIARRYIRVLISDTGNADGYVQIGRLWIGSGFSPTINFEPGAQFSFETSSESFETEGGRFHHVTRPTRRTMNFTLPEMEDDEAYVHLYRLMEKLGTTGQFLFAYDMADTTHLHRRAFLASFKQLGGMGVNFGLRVSTPFSIKEEL